MLEAQGLVSSPEIFREMIERWRELPKDWEETVFIRGCWGLSPTSIFDLLEVDAERLGIERSSIDQFASRIHQTMVQTSSSEGRKKALAIINGPHHLEDARRQILGGMIRYWPGWEEAGFQSWIEGVNDARLLESVSQSLASRADQQGPLKMNSPVEQLEAISAGEGHGGFSSGVWSKGELSEATRFFSQMPAKEKEVLIGRLNENILHEAMPVEFGATLMKYALEDRRLGGSSEKMVNDQMNEFLTTWTRDEPARAAEWSSSLSSGSESLKAQLRVAAIWNRYAPDEAREWAETLQPQVREAVLNQLE